MCSQSAVSWAWAGRRGASRSISAACETAPRSAAAPMTSIAGAPSSSVRADGTGSQSAGRRPRPSTEPVERRPTGGRAGPEQPQDHGRRPERQRRDPGRLVPGEQRQDDIGTSRQRRIRSLVTPMTRLVPRCRRATSDDLRRPARGRDRDEHEVVGRRGSGSPTRTRPRPRRRRPAARAAASSAAYSELPRPANSDAPSGGRGRIEASNGDAARDTRRSAVRAPPAPRAMSAAKPPRGRSALTPRPSNRPRMPSVGAHSHDGR